MPGELTRGMRVGYGLGSVATGAFGTAPAPSTVAGSVTSGGTGSILLAVQTARDAHLAITTPDVGAAVRRARRLLFKTFLDRLSRPVLRDPA